MMNRNLLAVSSGLALAIGEIADATAVEGERHVGILRQRGRGAQGLLQSHP